MTIHVYLDGTDDPGEWLAWVLDLIGCAAFAPTEKDALAKVPQVVAEYCKFKHRHGRRDDAYDFVGRKPVVVERLVAVDEGLFDGDREEASSEQIEHAIEVLMWSRADLLEVLASVPEAAFDWDPPYRRYASWAEWRSIREVLAHIAICETRYYLRGIGYDPGPNPPTAGGPKPGSRAWYAALGRDWRTLLARTRRETVAFLREVARSSDRRRIHEEPGYCWSVRKALRRLVWHELIHTKNIRRILRDFSRQPL
jgi:predicted RNase H-like HicB family nuclease